MTYIGRGISIESLRDYYKFATATIILSKRETFSMVVAESISAGTPVVGFKNGGSESSAIKELSSFVDYSDIDSLVNKIKEVEQLSTSIATYNKKDICKEYVKLSFNNC